MLLQHSEKCVFPWFLECLSATSKTDMKELLPFKGARAYIQLCYCTFESHDKSVKATVKGRNGYTVPISSVFNVSLYFACTLMFKVDEVDTDVTRILWTAEYVFRGIFPLKISRNRVQPSCVFLFLQISPSADAFGMFLLDERTEEYLYCTQNLFSFKDNVTGSRP